MADALAYGVDALLVDDQLQFTLTTLCRATGADIDQLLALVQEGLLHPVGDRPEDWRFSGAAMPQARLALRLTRDLDIGLAGAAVVMDLLAEISRLQARLRCLGAG
jgi:chaperone modulatory protein CbpM